MDPPEDKNILRSNIYFFTKVSETKIGRRRRTRGGEVGGGVACAWISCFGCKMTSASFDIYIYPKGLASRFLRAAFFQLGTDIQVWVGGWVVSKKNTSERRGLALLQEVVVCCCSHINSHNQVRGHRTVPTSEAYDQHDQHKKIKTCWN